MAVRSVIASKYRNAGQTCVCANRILVQHGVHDAFTKRLAETAGAMKVASSFEPGAVIGPLIEMKAVEKVEAHIADAVKKGAKMVAGGKRAAQGGSFFEPTILTDVTTDMVITKEETFGPVAPLYRFKSEADAVKMANDTPSLPFPARGGGKRGGRLLFLRPRHRPHLARRRGARIRHRHQRGHYLDRDRAVQQLR
jgi:succinate-semialdehyde dehydrogenase/glutarate-semialdehyde dehydrogenase